MYLTLLLNMSDGIHTCLYVYIYIYVFIAQSMCLTLLLNMSVAYIHVCIYISQYSSVHVSNNAAKQGRLGLEGPIGMRGVQGPAGEYVCMHVCVW